MTALDYPAMCAIVRGLLDRACFLAPAPDVRREAELGGEVAHLAVVVTLVEAEPLRCPARHLGTGDDDTFEGLTRQLEVVAVRSGDDDGEGDALGLCQQAALGAALGPVGRVWTRFFPPRGAPSSSRRPSRASASPRRRTRRSRPARTPRLARTRPPPSTRRSADAPTSSSRCPSLSVRSTGSPCEARTGSRSSRYGPARARCDIRAGAACPTESTARSATKARPECSTYLHAPPVPCTALHRTGPRWTALHAPHANLSARQTFMEHMELPRLLG